MSSSFVRRVANAGLSPDMPLALRKRLVVTNSLACTIALITAPYVLIFMLAGVPTLGLLVIPIVLGYLAVVGLNGLGWYRGSRPLMLLVGNTAVTLYTAALGPAAGIQLYFFANLCFPFVLFQPNERRGLAFGLAAPMLLYTLLWAGAGGEPWVALAPATLHLITLSIVLSAFATLIAAFLYLALVNRRAETELLREVRERGGAEARLAASEARLRSLFECVDDVVFLLDLEHRYLEVNNAVERHGGRRAEMLGRRVTDLLAPADAEEYCRVQTEVIATRRSLRIERQLPADGRPDRWFSTIYSPVLDPEGRVTGIAASARDVTRERTRQAELERALDAAEAANRAKSEFLATMNHEIRTPISAMLGFTELLAEPGLPEAQRLQATDALQRNGRHLMTLIDAILDLARLEADQLRIQRSPVALRREISDVVAQLQSLAVRKGLALQLAFAAGLPEVVDTDPTRLRQVLVNLIGNAIKFTDQGAVVVTVAEAATVLPGQAPGRLAVLVEDSGRGIDAAAQAVLFQPFMQGDAFLARRHEGAGLGLFLAKRLAQAMGGDVVLVRSVPGVGSVFAATLDLRPCATGGGPAAAAPEPGLRPTAAGQALAGTRLLFVDDSDDNRQLFGIFLESEGAVVTLAASGAEGLARATSETFDAVLLDLQMPLLDGYRVAAALRARGPGPPLIAVTAHATSDERDRCLAAGFTSFMTKPLLKAQLIKEVSRVLAASR